VAIIDYLLRQGADPDEVHMGETAEELFTQNEQLGQASSLSERIQY